MFVELIGGPRDGTLVAAKETSYTWTFPLDNDPNYCCYYSRSDPNKDQAIFQAVCRVSS